jgi:hypothetical protein
MIKIGYPETVELPDGGDKDKFEAACSITTSLTFTGNNYCILDKNYKTTRTIWVYGVFLGQDAYTSEF